MHEKKLINMLERSECLADRTKHHLQKCKESSNMALIGHPSSQPSLDISPIWTSIMTQRSLKTTASSVVYVKKLFLCWYHTEKSSV
jgi:hypothetical protein